MSILISAPIRTGKTLYVMKCIFDELNKGRMVYTNIVGIKVDGVISVASSIEQPFDWRDLPNGSVLVWDEAHEHPAFSSEDLLKEFKIDETEYNHQIDLINDLSITQTEKKRRIDQIERLKRDELNKRKEQIKDIGRGLLLHGHFGIEIYFITQRPAKLNADVLASVTTHFVMRRKFGMDAAMIWEFGEAMTSWSKSTAEIALNKKLWRYPKHLYNFYTSSESHQVRKSFPAKYYAFALIPVLFFAYGVLNAKDSGFFGLFGKDEKEVIATEKTPQTQPESLAKPSIISKDELNNMQDETQRIASIFDSSSGCRAYSGTGELLPISTEYCRHLSNNPAMLRAATQEVREERLQAINYTQYNSQASNYAPESF